MAGKRSRRRRGGVLGLAGRIKRAILPGRRGKQGMRSGAGRGGRLGPGTYPNRFTPPTDPPEPPGAWVDPPDIEGPAASLDPAEAGPAAKADAGPRRFDVELFEALNAEYASQRMVENALRYDMDSVAERARRRLEAIHDEVDLAHKTVLEVGCGTGVEVWYLANRFGSDGWGIDIRPRRGWPVLEGQRVHLIAGDMSGISGPNGLPTAAFDRVISNTVWEHIEHPHGALAEVHRTLKPGGLAWIRANLHRSPTASHLYRDIYFPFPHLLFTDDVIAEAQRRAGKKVEGAAWVNRLTWEQYDAHIHELGFVIRALRFDLRPLDEAFYARFEDILGRYPRRDLERTFFTVVLEKPAAA